MSKNDTVITNLSNGTAERSMMHAALLAVDAILLEAQVRRKADKKRAQAKARDYAHLAREFEQRMEKEAVRDESDLWDVARGAGLVP